MTEFSRNLDRISSLAVDWQEDWGRHCSSTYNRFLNLNFFYHIPEPVFAEGTIWGGGTLYGVTGGCGNCWGADECIDELLFPLGLLVDLEKLRLHIFLLGFDSTSDPWNNPPFSLPPSSFDLLLCLSCALCATIPSSFCSGQPEILYAAQLHLFFAFYQFPKVSVPGLHSTGGKELPEKSCCPEDGRVKPIEVLKLAISFDWNNILAFCTLLLLEE